MPTPSNPYSAYLEARILSAEPIELIRMLYQGALDAVCDARTHLAAGHIEARGKAISKAADILRELSFALNHERGPALARNLVELYDYLQRRLLVAHLEQSDEPLAEVARLLTTMSEAWEKLDTVEEPGAGSRNRTPAEA